MTGFALHLTSLARRTDLIFSRYNGTVTDRGHYLVIKTPSNPGHHWGNFIIFESAPAKGDYQRWTRIFAEEFSHYDTIRHMIFAWDTTEPGDCDEFIANGFERDKGVVLATDAVVTPPKFNSEVAVRKVTTDQQWQDALANRVACSKSIYDSTRYLEFKTRQMAQFRKMSQEGRGAWYGAYLGGRLVADLGVFFEAELGRYQQVGTHPKFRRQGICQTLVYETARIALQRPQVTKLVMEADAHYHAARIYESVGFKPVEHNYALGWWLPGG